MAGSGGHHHHELLAVADATMVFPPVHFGGIGGKVRAGDVVVGAEFGPAEAAEKALGLIGAAFAVAVDLGMVDPLGQEAGVQLVPMRGFVGVDGAAGRPNSWMTYCTTGPGAEQTARESVRPVPEIDKSPRAGLLSCPASGAIRDRRALQFPEG